MEHRGDVRGSDECGRCSSGVILGFAHHGRHEIRRRAAWLDARAEHQSKGVDLTYGDVGDVVLEQMRELDTAQCALRIGRGKDGRDAVVLIDTIAVPRWIPLVNPDNPATIEKWSKGDWIVRDAVASLIEAGTSTDADDGTGRVFVRTNDVYDEIEQRDTEVSKRWIRKLLERHVDRGLLGRMTDPDDGRRSVWIDTGLATTSDDEAATVSLPEIRDVVGSNDEDADADNDADEVTELSRMRLLYAVVPRLSPLLSIDDLTVAMDCRRDHQRQQLGREW